MVGMAVESFMVCEVNLPDHPGKQSASLNEHKITTQTLIDAVEYYVFNVLALNSSHISLHEQDER